MSKPTILVTGGTGYIGGHVVDQLLKQGYNVKAIVRPGREPALRTAFPDAPASQLVAVELSSLAAGDYSEALKGVTGVIHLAIPNPDKGAPSDVVLDGIYNGTLHIVRSAVKAGVKKIVVSGSTSSTFDSTGTPGSVKDGLIGPDSWGPWKTAEDCANLEPFPTYQAAKTIAERDLFKIAAEHRKDGFEIVSVVMPVVYGPYPPNFPAPKSRQDLSIHNIVYSLLTGGPSGPNTWPFDPTGTSWLIDARDAAKAHILALDAPSTPYDKRIIVAGKTFKWTELAEVVRELLPEHAHRLPSSELPPPQQSPFGLDLTLSKELLGLKESDYIPYGETVVESIKLGLLLEQ